MPLFRGNAEEMISTLIAAIYDAALDPRKWQDFVDTVCREMDGVEPVFYLADTRSAIMETLLVSENWGHAFLTDYMAHYNALNPWTPALASAAVVGRPVIGDEVIPDRAFKRSEFYNDFFKYYWDWSSVVGVVNYRDSNAFSVLGLHCTRKLFEREADALSRVAGRLAPHIMRAFEISRQLQHGAARKASLELMLESLNSPALLIGADLRVRYANDAAEEVFRSGALALDSQGRIVAGACANETRELHLALTAALARPPTAQGAPSIKLTRPDDDARSAMPLLVRVMPCAGGLERAVDIASPVPPVAAEPDALVLITDPAAKLQLRPGTLRQVFGLTPAEARLSQALVQGASLTGYAADAAIAEGTARAQLNAIFAKTGTHRQAELVALLAQLAGCSPFAEGPVVKNRSVYIK